MRSILPPNDAPTTVDTGERVLARDGLRRLGRLGLERGGDRPQDVGALGAPRAGVAETMLDADRRGQLVEHIDRPLMHRRRDDRRCSHGGRWSGSRASHSAATCSNTACTRTPRSAGSIDMIVAASVSSLTPSTYCPK